MLISSYCSEDPCFFIYYDFYDMLCSIFSGLSGLCGDCSIFKLLLDCFSFNCFSKLIISSFYSCSDSGFNFPNIFLYS